MPMTWEDWPESARGIFQGFRSPKGEDLVLERNMFVEAVLPSSIIRDLSDDEMATYRAPFDSPEHRQPTLNWPRQIPIDGDPPPYGRTGGCLRHLYGQYGYPQTVHQRRPRFHFGRETKGVLPHVAQSDRGHGGRLAFRARRLPARDWSGSSRLACKLIRRP